MRRRRHQCSLVGLRPPRYARHSGGTSALPATIVFGCPLPSHSSPGGRGCPHLAGLYFENNLLLAEASASAHALRTFLGLHPYRQQESKVAASAAVDESSVLLKCKLGGGKVGKGCVLVNVCAPSVDIEGCILVNVRTASPTSGQ